MNRYGNLDHTTLHKTLCGSLLQPCYTIEIKKRGDNKSVTFISRIHVNKMVECKFSWSSKFSDSQILMDCNLREWISDKYGEVCQ